MITDLRAVYQARTTMKDHLDVEYSYSPFIDDDGVHYFDFGVAVRNPGNKPPQLPTGYVPGRACWNHKVDLKIDTGWYVDGLHVDDIVAFVENTDEIEEWLPRDEMECHIRWNGPSVTVQGATFYYEELIARLLGEDELADAVREERHYLISNWSYDEFVEFFENYDIPAVCLSIADIVRIDNAHEAVAWGYWPC